MTLLEEAKEERKITVQELFEMELEERYFYELVNGYIIKKRTPSPFHQQIVTELTSSINAYTKEKQLGDCYVSPIDVFFDKYNNTQPDVLFIKKDRLFIVTHDGIMGHPDLIVEVLSPSTYRNDRTSKKDLYCQFGVPEYWIVDPKNQAIEVYSLENDDYTMSSFAIETGEIESKVLEGFKMDIALVFA
jgi:Uma2 family endonuclease